MKAKKIILLVVIGGSISLAKSLDTKISRYLGGILTETGHFFSKQTDKVSFFTKNTAKKELKHTISVDYKDFNYIKNGVKQTLKVPDFSKHTVFQTKLPEHLIIASDKSQFQYALQSLHKNFLSNREAVIKQLQEQNALIMKRDTEFLKANKNAIYEAENKMLEAAKKGNLEDEQFWLKELRKHTNKITFIDVYKGKSLKLYTQEDILQRQLKDIENSITRKQYNLFGYIWHHNENVGIMDLVAKDIHEFNKHTGGNSIWGNNMR